MSKTIVVFAFLLFFILVDLYAYQGVKVFSLYFNANIRQWIKVIYWLIVFVSVSLLLFIFFGDPDFLKKETKTFIQSGIFILYISKVVYLLFLLLDDLQRFLRWGFKEAKTAFDGNETVKEANSSYISRSQFLATAGIVVASVPFLSLSWGILSGAHDYRVRKVKIPLRNLPSAFDGLKIVQLSDIHSGSLWNRAAVKAGVEMAMALKPDVIFFTGDLVNNKTEEVADWISVFSKFKAPLGVYSILGNHDYGDYTDWRSPAEKAENMKNMLKVHKVLGWDLLMDEHRIKEVDGQKLAIVGVQNWGAKARFPRYGNLSRASEGLDDVPVKLLLSHDPSHWRAQILPDFPSIDVTFSGHTHGMQFGVEIPGFKWSPVQYMYKEWAGLYKENNSFLYVNRGFGYIGYPGRVGIPPEISLIELKKQ